MERRILSVYTYIQVEGCLDLRQSGRSDTLARARFRAWVVWRHSRARSRASTRVERSRETRVEARHASYERFSIDLL